MDNIIIPQFQFCRVIDEICAFPWSSLSSDDMVDVAWAYYFFSIQFRECLSEARRLYPADERLRQLEAEECDTDNLSPWPGVAAAGERMNHDEYMRRTLALLPFTAARAPAFEGIGRRYLAATRCVYQKLYPAILMMKSAENRLSGELAEPLNWPMRW